MSKCRCLSVVVVKLENCLLREPVKKSVENSTLGFDPGESVEVLPQNNHKIVNILSQVCMHKMNVIK